MSDRGEVEWKTLEIAENTIGEGVEGVLRKPEVVVGSWMVGMWYMELAGEGTIPASLLG